MKATAVSAIIPAICVFLALPSMTDGARDRIQVYAEDVVFFIDRYDDGRSLPYVVTFTDLGFKSVYKFNNDGKVSKIKADGDDYTVKYRRNGRVRSVTRDGARRDLAEGFEGSVRTMVEDSSSEPHRRLYTCEDCTEAWNNICFTGVGTVCDLVTYGDSFLPPAETSLDVLCSSLSGVCETLPAQEACSGQCGECLPPLTITLEWFTDSGLGDTPFMDLVVIEPSNNVVNRRSLEGDAGFVTEFVNKRVYTVFPQLPSDIAVGVFIAFGEWYAGSGPVSWTLVAVAGSGEVVFAGEGDFSGNCGSTTSQTHPDSSTTTTTSGSLDESLATTRMVYVELVEYVDTGCEVVSAAVDATSDAKRSSRPWLVYCIIRSWVSELRSVRVSN